MHQNEQNGILRRIRNRIQTAEGSLIPPRQIGNTRVPLVTAVQLLQSTKNGTAGTNFTLTWLNPIERNINIDHYLVTVSGVRGSVGNQFQLMATTLASPATVFVAAPTGTVVTFTIQTVMGGGLTSILTISPTISGTCL